MMNRETLIRRGGNLPPVCASGVSGRQKSRPYNDGLDVGAWFCSRRTINE